MVYVPVTSRVTNSMANRTNVLLLQSKAMNSEYVHLYIIHCMHSAYITYLASNTWIHGQVYLWIYGKQVSISYTSKQGLYVIDFLCNRWQIQLDLR